MATQRRFRNELPEDSPIWAHMINKCLIDDDMTQKQLAEKAGVSEGTIAGWLAGTEPKAIGLINLADALNTTTDYILGRADWRKSKPDDVAISKITGLSDVVLSRIRNTYKSSPEILTVFNAVTASTEFACLMEMLFNYILRVKYIDDSKHIAKRNDMLIQNNIINPFVYSIGAADTMIVAMQRCSMAIIDFCLAHIIIDENFINKTIRDCNNEELNTEHGITHTRKKPMEAADNDK